MKQKTIWVLFAEVMTILILLQFYPRQYIFAEGASDVTPAEIESWGFSWEDYQSRVKKRFELMKQQQDLSKQNLEYFVKAQKQKQSVPEWMDAPEEVNLDYNFEFSTEEELYRQASRETAHDFWMNRAELQRMTPERFRQEGFDKKNLRYIDRRTERLADEVVEARRRLSRAQDRSNMQNNKEGARKAHEGNRGENAQKSSSPPEEPRKPPTPEEIRAAGENTVKVDAASSEATPRNDEITSRSPSHQDNITQRIDEEGPRMGQGDRTSRQPLQGDGSTTQRASTDGPRMGHGEQTARRPSPAPTGSGGAATTDASLPIDDPLAQADWKPIDKKPPARTPEPSLTDTVGTTIAISLMNIESIIECRDAGVPAMDCLAGLMFSNGLAVSLELATQLLSAATLVKIAIGGQVLLVIKGASDTYDILYNLEDWASARYEAYLAEQRHADWAEHNVAARDMPGYIQALRQRIDETLAPYAEQRDALCKRQKKLDQDTKYNADRAEVILQQMPSESEIYAFADLTDKSLDAVTSEKMLTSELDRLKAAFRNADPQVPGASLRSAVEDLTGKAREHQSVENELIPVRKALDKAFDQLGQITTQVGKSTTFDQMHTEMARIEQIEADLDEAAGRLRMELRGLRRAYPDEMDTQWREELLALRDLIDEYVWEHCRPSNTAQRRGSELAANVKLDAERRLQPVDTLHAIISRLTFGTGARVLAEAENLLKGESPVADSGEQTHDDEEDSFADMGTGIGDGSSESEETDVEDGGGFIDEGTSLASSGESSQDTPPSDENEQDSFEDMGTSVGASAPPETVTYFNRDWLPRSWKTSGDAGAVRAEIYQTATRLGWAAALAEYTGRASDGLITDHLATLPGHMERANAASFAPHKAWPNWEQYRRKYQRWVERMTTGSANSREYFRKGLGNSLKSDAAALRRQLETVSQAQAGTLQNCDSYVFEIGYQLAYASQVQSIAIEGMKAGEKKDWARRLFNRASSSATIAGRDIQEIKPGPDRAGCIDYSSLSQELNRVKSHLQSAPEPELYGVWEKGLVLTGGHVPGDLECGGKLEGIWLNNGYSGMILRITRQGDRYVGTFPHVTPQWQQWGYLPGQTYFELRETAPNKYEGSRLHMNCPGCATGSKWETDTVKFQVFGQWLDSSMPLEANVWQRLNPGDLSKLSVRTNQFGVERYFIPGFFVPHTFDKVTDCLGPRSATGKLYGPVSGTTQSGNTDISLFNSGNR